MIKEAVREFRLNQIMYDLCCPIRTTIVNYQNVKKFLQSEYRSDYLLYILLFVVCRYNYNVYSLVIDFCFYRTNV